MKSSSVEEIINRIDKLHQIHLSLRGIVQYVGEHHNGKDKLNWGTKLPSNWIDIEFKFQNKITPETRTELNVIAEYLNQNFIIRLHSLLEYEGIKSKKIEIDSELEGFEMIEIVHFLRKQYAHRLGIFDSNDEDSVKLRTRLFEQFNINPNESQPTQFPLDKNRVIKPMVEGIKKYVRTFWKKYKN